MTRWDSAAGMHYLRGPCGLTARIDNPTGSFWVRVGRFGGSKRIWTCPSLAAAKCAGKRELRRRVIVARNEANSEAIECEEWLRVNR